MATLKEQIKKDLTAAMKSKETIAIRTLRSLLTAINNEEVAGKVARELGDADIITVLNREAKKRKEAVVAYQDAARPELAATEQAALDIIAAYLPEALSEIGRAHV